MNLFHLGFGFSACPAAVGRQESEKMSPKVSPGSTTLGFDDSSFSVLPTHAASLPGYASPKGLLDPPTVRGGRAGAIFSTCSRGLLAQVILGWRHGTRLPFCTLYMAFMKVPNEPGAIRHFRNLI